MAFMAKKVTQRVANTDFVVPDLPVGARAGRFLNTIPEGKVSMPDFSLVEFIARS